MFFRDMIESTEQWAGYEKLLSDLANFVGYVLWSVWLLIFAAVLVRRGARQPSRA